MDAGPDSRPRRELPHPSKRGLKWGTRAEESAGDVILRRGDHSAIFDLLEGKMPKWQTLNHNKGRTHIGTIFIGGIPIDGGGYEISPTKSGGYVIKRIPPMQPAFERLSAMAALVARAESVKSPKLKAQLIELATQVATEALGAPAVVRL